MSAHDFRYRQATLPDVPQVTALVEQYWKFEEVPGFDAARIAPLLERIIRVPSLGTIWVAQSGTTLVGYLVAVFVLSLEHQGLMAEIDEFFLLPEVRAKGAGQALLASVERELAQHGCVRVQLQLGIGNEAARGFYRRNGYEQRAGYELLDKKL